MNVITLRQKVDKIKSQYDLAYGKLRNERQNLQTIKEHLSHMEQAQQITQTVAQTIQQQAHQKIAKVVTACLKTVFIDKDYAFEIRFERKRKRTEAKLILLKDGHEVDDPIDGESGGVLDVASFSLQLSAIMLNKPSIRKLMVMDETFKFVSVEYRNNVQQMLTKLAKDFGIQFIMVTSHQSQIMAGKVIDL